MIRDALKFGTFVVVCLFFTGYLAFTIGNLNVRDPLGQRHVQDQRHLRRRHRA